MALWMEWNGTGWNEWLPDTMPHPASVFNRQFLLQFYNRAQYIEASGLGTTGIPSNVMTQWSSLAAGLNPFLGFNCQSTYLLNEFYPRGISNDWKSPEYKWTQVGEKLYDIYDRNKRLNTYPGWLSRTNSLQKYRIETASNLQERIWTPACWSNRLMYYRWMFDAMSAVFFDSDDIGGDAWTILYTDGDPYGGKYSEPGTYDEPRQYGTKQFRVEGREWGYGTAFYSDYIKDFRVPHSLYKPCGGALIAVSDCHAEHTYQDAYGAWNFEQTPPWPEPDFTDNRLYNDGVVVHVKDQLVSDPVSNAWDIPGDMYKGPRVACPDTDSFAADHLIGHAMNLQFMYILADETPAPWANTYS